MIIIKKIKMVMVITLCLLAFSVKSYSDLPDCANTESSCTSTWLLDVHTISGHYCPACQIYYEYYYRNCVDVNGTSYYEYYLNGVAYNGQNDDCLNCLNTYYTGNEAFIYLFLEAMHDLVQNYVPKPTKNNPQINIRLTTSGCWKLGTGITNPFTYQRCENSPCCSSTYTYTYENGNITMKFDGSELTTGTCDPSCTVLQCPLNNLVYYKAIIHEESNISNSLNQVVESMVFPNPTEDIINFQYNFPQNGNIDLKILNLNGEIVFETSKQKKTENDIIQLNLSKLLNGSYYYNLILENVIISKGKLLIQK